MTYIDLINAFWKKDIERGFSEKEITLYFYLLGICNSIGWKSPFGLSNAMTMAKFGWGKKSLDTIKLKLKTAGLIDFKAGSGRGNINQYTIIDSPQTQPEPPKQKKEKPKTNNYGSQFKTDFDSDAESLERKSEILRRAAKAVANCDR